MDQTNALPLGTITTLPLPPFAAAAPAFAVAVAGGVAFAFTDPAGGTWVSWLDQANRWGTKIHLPLSLIGMVACGDELVLGGLRLPDGAVVLVGVANEMLNWTAPLPISGRRLHGPFPVCDTNVVNGVWVSENAPGRSTLYAAEVSHGSAGTRVGVPLETTPLEIDVTAYRGVPVAVWIGGGRLSVSAARIVTGATPIFQGLEGAASPHTLRTQDGLAWIAVGPKGLRAQRVNSNVAPDGAQFDLGEGFAPILVAEAPGRAVLFARSSRTLAGMVAISGPGSREEPLYATETWAASLDLTSLELGPKLRVAAANGYIAAALTARSLFVVHIDNAQLSVFAVA